jgi:hypothetical protein
MNRGCFAGLAIAASVAAGLGAPAAAKDAPTPSLSVDPITARTLLAPVEEGRAPAAAYRLDPNAPATGQRARLSIDLGEATIFAITGRLNRQPAPTGPLDGGHARALGQRRDSGKVYGLGVARTVRGFDIGATYQFSKLRAEQPMPDGDLGDGGPGRSHSLRATARIRFRP